jgi:hypothetical protein
MAEIRGGTVRQSNPAPIELALSCERSTASSSTLARLPAASEVSRW